MGKEARMGRSVRQLEDYVVFLEDLIETAIQTAYIDLGGCFWHCRYCGSNQFQPHEVRCWVVIAQDIIDKERERLRSLLPLKAQVGLRRLDEYVANVERAFKDAIIRRKADRTCERLLGEETDEEMR